MPRTLLRNLLTATAFLVAGTAAASESASPRCRVGNGKNPSYKNGVFTCLLARAQGKKVAFVAPTEGRQAPGPVMTDQGGQLLPALDALAQSQTR